MTFLFFFVHPYSLNPSRYRPSLTFSCSFSQTKKKALSSFYYTSHFYSHHVFNSQWDFNLAVNVVNLFTLHTGETSNILKSSIGLKKKKKRTFFDRWPLCLVTLATLVCFSNLCTCCSLCLQHSSARIFLNVLRYHIISYLYIYVYVYTYT